MRLILSSQLWLGKYRELQKGELVYYYYYYGQYLHMMN